MKISNSTFEINYEDSTHICVVFNNGHTIQYNFEPGDYINLNSIRYNLIQFHFHEPAEHLINGMRYPMEIHLVHSNEKGSYTVLSIMAQEGSGSPPFEFLELFLPINVNETITVDQAFNLNLNLPSNRSLFNYTDSLTTPPCIEGVQ